MHDTFVPPFAPHLRRHKAVMSLHPTDLIITLAYHAFLAFTRVETTCQVNLQGAPSKVSSDSDEPGSFAKMERVTRRHPAEFGRFRF